MLDDIRKPEAGRREWIVEALKDENGMYTGYLHKGELVRCKDCIYGKIREVDGKEQVYCDYQFDWWNMDGFCSYGEARNE